MIFGKQVWHDRKHQVEVFTNTDGVLSGSILTCKRGICLVNPRPEVLIALYQEAKIKRILSLNAVVITSHIPEVVRGLCTLIGYSRELRRRRPLSIYVRRDDTISPMFLNSCCAKLLKHRSQFEMEIVPVGIGEEFEIGEARFRFETDGEPGDALVRLVVSTDTRRFHYVHQTTEVRGIEEGEADVVIRDLASPRYRSLFAAPQPAVPSIDEIANEVVENGDVVALDDADQENSEGEKKEGRPSTRDALPVA